VNEVYRALQALIAPIESPVQKQGRKVMLTIEYASVLAALQSLIKPV
jgi:hypothetical protein